MHLDVSVTDFMHSADPALADAMKVYLDASQDEDAKHQAHEVIVSRDGFRRWNLQVEILKYFHI